MIDSSTVYQIFYQTYRGMPQTIIMAELGITRHTIRRHLQGRYMHRYSEATQRRIKALCMPALERKIEAPKPWIRIEDVTYFLPWRPKPRTIIDLPMYASLEREKICGFRTSHKIVATRREWILDFLVRTIGKLPNGVCLTRGACVKLGIKPTFTAGQRFLSVHSLSAIPEMPSGTISWCLRIQDWTGMPFVTIAETDL